MKKIVSCSELFPEPDQAGDGLVTRLQSSTTEESPEESSTTSPLEKDVRRLRETVLRTLVNEATGRYQVPRNILLIGQASSGKSSYVNLLKSALLGRYDQIAQPGSATEGSCPQFTNRLVPYHNMGFSESELDGMKQEFPNIQFPDDFRLPTICDMPGLEDRPQLVLDCILDGIVPDDTELVIPLANDRLPPVDFSTPEDRIIDRVVFVASITQDVSCHLFKEAFNVAFRKRGIPYVLIFTHVDQAEIFSNNGEGQETKVDVCRRAAKNLLWIEKNSKLLSHDIVNYCDEDPTSEFDSSEYQVDFEKHKNALESFKKIIKPKKLPTWRRISNRYDLMYRYLSFKLSRVLEGAHIRHAVLFVLLAMALYGVLHGLPKL